MKPTFIGELFYKGTLYLVDDQDKLYRPGNIQSFLNPNKPDSTYSLCPYDDSIIERIILGGILHRRGCEDWKLEEVVNDDDR
jgi:hypothetical protein